jgi:hypothetical protein
MWVVLLPCSGKHGMPGESLQTSTIRLTKRHAQIGLDNVNCAIRSRPGASSHLPAGIAADASPFSAPRMKRRQAARGLDNCLSRTAEIARRDF